MYKHRFEKLLKEKEKVTADKGKPIKAKIPEDIIHRILKELNAFEKNKGYITPGITSQILAKKFKTNSKYLSSVVNHFKTTKVLSII